VSQEAAAGALLKRSFIAVREGQRGPGGGECSVANGDSQHWEELLRALEELRGTLEELREARRGLEEFVKLRYDMIKHNTTLAVASAVALIGLSKGDALPIIPLLLLAVSAIAGVLAMPMAAGLLLREGDEYKRDMYAVYWMHGVSATTLVVAVAWYALLQ
jgi:hypothetical protein